jgi:cysteine-rich repeat protein
MPRASLFLLLVVLLAPTSGCRLDDEASRHRCLTDENCAAGRFCVEFQCVSTRPPAADGAADAERGDAGSTPDVPPSPDLSIDSGDDQGSLDGQTPAVCGNSRREEREECDDGNRAEDDLCDNRCLWTHPPQISATGAHTCLRTGDLRVRCWGSNSGLALSLVPRSAATIVTNDWGACYIRDDGVIGCPADRGYYSQRQNFAPAGQYRDLSFRGERACAVTTDGALECWGPSYPDGPTPPGKYAAVSLGSSHACALAASGAVVCWGRDESGESQPPPGRFVRVAVGDARSCAIRDGGALVCWGAVALSPPGPYRSLAVGEDRICAVSRDGAAQCWTLGGAVSPVTPGIYTEVAVGAAHACALRVDGGVSCWGSNDSLQLGIPAGPYLQVSTVNDLVNSSGCGVKLNHDLVCWGRFDPLAYPGAPSVPTGKFTSVAVTPDFSCAIHDSGGLDCWGADAAGEDPPWGGFRQVAPPWALHSDGSLASWTRGMTVPPDLFSEITAGAGLGCGLRVNGKVACWNERAEPIPTPLAGTFKSLAQAGRQLCALRADGTVACIECQKLAEWTCQLTPPGRVAVGPFTKIGRVQECLCGLTRDGLVQCWNLPLDGDCTAPTVDGGKAVDFWDGCAMSERGVLFCEQPFKSIDLDRP